MEKWYKLEIDDFGNLSYEELKSLLDSNGYETKRTMLEEKSRWYGTKEYIERVFEYIVKIKSFEDFENITILTKCPIKLKDEYITILNYGEE